MNETTIVTFLFDIASRESGSERRSVAQYLESGAFLMRLDVDLICFAEPGIEDLIRARRDGHGLLDRTALITCELEELQTPRRLEAATRAREQHPLFNASLPKDTPLHSLVGCSRFEVLGRAIEMNPFDAVHFAWMDFGVAHLAKTDHVQHDRVFSDTPDEVRMLQMRPFDSSLVLDRPHHLQYRRGHFAAGFISGRAASLQQLCEIAAGELEAALAEQFAPLDEHLLELAVAHAPALFSLYPGDYDFILANYRHLRGSGANLLHQLRCLRGAQQWTQAAALASRVLEAVATDRFDCDPPLLAQILEESFIVSYYAEDGERRQARDLAALYADRAHADPDFRDEFLRHEIRVRTNLGFVQQTV